MFLETHRRKNAFQIQSLHTVYLPLFSSLSESVGAGSVEIVSGEIVSGSKIFFVGFADSTGVSASPFGAAESTKPFAGAESTGASVGATVGVAAGAS
jgi:hypothetical protein